MASISTWYSGQYANWNRTRRLSTAPYLARQNTNTARTAAALIRNSTAGQEAVVIDMGDLNSGAQGEKKKKQDTLFGPNIGIANSGPAWTESTEKKPSSDQLTPEIVKEWIAKSKEASQPTTTLQALVNLKRPTLRLSPLSIAPNDDPDHKDSHDHHGLEFEFDCDAPKCGIYVHVVLSSDEQNAISEDQPTYSKVLVFETVVDGGFGKLLKLEEGATLELGRFEKHHRSVAKDPSTSDSNVAAATEKAVPTTEGSRSNDDARARNDRKSRRFTAPFHFRRRDHNRQVAGPALAVVDAEPASTEENKDKEQKADAKDEEGVKVAIRLVALDGEGNPLSSPNEQGTYLHVIRVGNKPAEGEEDTRPWVVQVVKREATIGPHTFHLHEIYGLTSHSSAPAQPTAPAPASSPTTTETESHTYPPTSPAPQTTVIREEEPSSECLLCLSSPREVVLLPCRHLVACKECAINMVEFGAGGTIVQPEEPSTGGDSTAAGGADGANTEAGANATPTTTVQNARRKRRAKGWFCPVCRQPYTSLLRITTTPPAKEEKDIENRPSTSTEGQAEPATEASETPQPQLPAPALVATPRGAFASLRPSFLRGGSRASSNAQAESQPAPTLPPDLERGPDPAPSSS